MAWRSLRSAPISATVADAVLHLLSPLSRFITGQDLRVNAGMYMGQEP